MEEKKFARGHHPNSKENLRAIDNSDEAINNAKSEGKIQASIKRNLLETLRTRIDEHNLIDDVVLGVVAEVQNRIYKNAIKLIDIARENEPQKIDLTNKTPQIVVANESVKSEIEKLMQNAKNNKDI